MVVVVAVLVIALLLLSCFFALAIAVAINFDAMLLSLLLYDLLLLLWPERCCVVCDSIMLCRSLVREVFFASGFAKGAGVLGWLVRVRSFHACRNACDFA